MKTVKENFKQKFKQIFAMILMFAMMTVSCVHSVTAIDANAIDAKSVNVPDEVIQGTFGYNEIYRGNNIPQYILDMYPDWAKETEGVTDRYVIRSVELRNEFCSSSSYSNRNPYDNVIYSFYSFGIEDTTVPTYYYYIIDGKDVLIEDSVLYYDTKSDGKFDGGLKEVRVINGLKHGEISYPPEALSGRYGEGFDYKLTYDQKKATVPTAIQEFMNKEITPDLSPIFSYKGCVDKYGNSLYLSGPYPDTMEPCMCGRFFHMDVRVNYPYIDKYCMRDDGNLGRGAIFKLIHNNNAIEYIWEDDDKRICILTYNGDGKDADLYGWEKKDGIYYWNEYNVRQGTVNDPNGVVGDGTVRGREIYDSVSDGWYWLDAVYDGAKAANKEVWMPYIYQNEASWSESEIAANAGNSGDMKDQVIREINNRSGKWVRYDENGKMYKGWYTVEGAQADIYPNQVGNTYYYDPMTGLMAKGEVNIDGVVYYFDETTGVLQR